MEDGKEGKLYGGLKELKLLRFLSCLRKEYRSCVTLGVV